ncbi:hypothetical protein BSG1_18885 [Bacillus sp. SG-1]|nr:hypothetical protein BSG1_18885 [Bacillus sp. SG-1]
MPIDEEATRANMKIQGAFYEDKDAIQGRGRPCVHQ